MNPRALSFTAVLIAVAACHRAPTQSPAPGATQPSTPATPTTPRATETPPAPPEPAVTLAPASLAGISLGPSDLFAWSRDGNAYRWSLTRPDYNHVALGAPSHVTSPGAVSKLTGSCALLADATVACLRGDSLQRIAGLTEVADLDDRGGVTCVAMRDGTVRCWGALSFSAEQHAPQETPLAIAGLANVVQVAVSARHACARMRDGTVSCWGTNAWGQLGDGSLDAHPAPVAVTGLTGAAEIAVGAVLSCAHMGDGAVQCWGAGFGPHPVPVAGAHARSVLCAGSTGYSENTAGTTWSTSLGAILMLDPDGSAHIATSGASSLETAPTPPDHAAPIAGTDHASAIAIEAESDIDGFSGNACALTTDALKCWPLLPEPGDAVTAAMVTAPRVVAPVAGGPTAAATPVACTGRARAAFHLRPTAVAESVGTEVADVASPLTVLERGPLRRGGSVLYHVRTASGAEGWTFLAPGDLATGCSADLRAR